MYLQEQTWKLSQVQGFWIGLCIYVCMCEYVFLSELGHTEKEKRLNPPIWNYFCEIGIKAASTVAGGTFES